MLSGSSQLRFLLRGSALLVAVLAAWWWALLNPMLSLLRVSATPPLSLFAGGGSVTVGPSGDWDFQIAVHDNARPPEAVFGSIEFTIPRSDIAAFTFSVPVYWAIALAAWANRRRVWPLILGTGIVSAVEVLSLVVFAEATAYSSLAELHHANGGAGRWSRELGGYLVTNVVPYAAPFLVAVALHREFWSRTFPSPRVPAMSGVRATAERSPRRRSGHNVN